MKTNPSKGRPWLEAPKSLEGDAKKDETSRTNTALPPVDEISESLVQRGAKSDKSLLSVPDAEDDSGVVDEEAKPREARRTLVTAQDQVAGVVANLKDVDLVALDLETTGLDPRKVFCSGQWNACYDQGVSADDRETVVAWGAEEDLACR